MEENFDIQKYMTQGVERIVADSLRATLKDPRESAFMVKFATSSKKASKIRAEEEKTEYISRLFSLRVLQAVVTCIVPDVIPDAIMQRRT